MQRVQRRRRWWHNQSLHSLINVELTSWIGQDDELGWPKHDAQEGHLIPASEQEGALLQGAALALTLEGGDTREARHSDHGARLN